MCILFECVSLRQTEHSSYKNICTMFVRNLLRHSGALAAGVAATGLFVQSNEQSVSTVSINSDDVPKKRFRFTSPFPSISLSAGVQCEVKILDCLRLADTQRAVIRHGTKSKKGYPSSFDLFC